MQGSIQRALREDAVTDMVYEKQVTVDSGAFFLKYLLCSCLHCQLATSYKGGKAHWLVDGDGGQTLPVQDAGHNQQQCKLEWDQVTTCNYNHHPNNQRTSTTITHSPKQRSRELEYDMQWQNGKSPYASRSKCCLGHFTH